MSASRLMVVAYSSRTMHGQRMDGESIPNGPEDELVVRRIRAIASLVLLHSHESISFYFQLCEYCYTTIRYLALLGRIASRIDGARGVHAAISPLHLHRIYTEVLAEKNLFYWDRIYSIRQQKCGSKTMCKA